MCFRRSFAFPPTSLYEYIRTTSLSRGIRAHFLYFSPFFTEPSTSATTAASPRSFFLRISVTRPRHVSATAAGVAARVSDARRLPTRAYRLMRICTRLRQRKETRACSIARRAARPVKLGAACGRARHRGRNHASYDRIKCLPTLGARIGVSGHTGYRGWLSRPLDSARQTTARARAPPTYARPRRDARRTIHLKLRRRKDARSVKSLHVGTDARGGGALRPLCGPMATARAAKERGWRAKGGQQRIL